MVDTEQFDKRNFERARADCERIEREDAGRKGGLTDRERQILDMWPKFEDGEHVWFGDEVSEIDARSIVFTENGAMITNLTSVPAYGKFLRCSEPLKRPAHKALDADGVEIHVGDTVYESNGKAGVVTAVHPSTSCVDLRQDDCDAYAMDAMRLTHTRPDSWERLEEDAKLSFCKYFGSKSGECKSCRNADGDEHCQVSMTLDIIRRAKALAGAEVE